MDKNKEVRRGSMSTRRRHRITSLRDSLDRDREVLNVNKRMKVERLAVQKRFNREDEEGADVDSSDEILDNNNDDDGGENNRRISPDSSSISSHSIRRPVRGYVRSPSMLKMIDEMVIGVPVPRKARSVSAKRSHENLSSGKEQSRRKFSPSPDVASCSSQSGSLKNKKMKSVKTRFRKSSTSTKSFSSVQDDIEIEVAEALFDLMKQSRSHSQSKSESSMKEERSSGVNKTADDKSICSPANIEVGANGKEVENGKEARYLMKLNETITAERIELRKGEVKDSYERSVRGDMNEESGTSTKLSADNPVYSASEKANRAAKAIEKKREGKFQIDLMGPPMPSSPERGGLFDYPQREIQDVQMKGEKGVLNEDKLVVKGQEGKKMESLYIEKEPSKCQAPIPGGQKFDQPISLPVTISGTSWPTGHPHPGRYTTLPIVMPVDESARSLTALQPPPFSLSKPRPKRCMTHQCIARSIKFHKHLTENSMLPAAVGTATLIGGKLHNGNPLQSAQDVIIGNNSQGDFPGRQTLAMGSGPNGNNVDAANGKQLMLQQGLQQIATANMLHGQAMVFQLGQQQAAVTSSTNQPGHSKYAAAAGNFGMPSNSFNGPPVSSFASSAGTTVVNFSNSNMPPNAASPYMAAIYQNNVYPLSFSTNVGAPPSNKGGAQAAVMPFLNGSYYSSPMFHISQCQPQQSRSQSQVQTSPLIQPHSQLQMGAQISHDTYFPQMPMLLQQSEKQRASHSQSADKPAAETSHNYKARITESPTSHSQNSNNSKTFLVPTSGNQNEQQKQQGSKGGYQLVPPQAFGLSFSSAASTTPTVSFSSITQNPTVFQFLPDMGRQVYQFGPGRTQMTQNKNFQMSDGRITVSSISNTQEKKGLSENSHVNAGQSRNDSKSSCCSEPSTSTPTGTAVIDSSGRTVSFVQLPVSNGSQTFHYSSTLPTSVASAYSTNSQQQRHKQFIHLQKQHQERQRTGTSQSKESNSNALSSSVITTNLPNNYPVSSQIVTQTSSSTQSSQLKYLPSSQGSSSTLNTTSLKGISQQQMIHPLSQTRVAFGSDSNISTGHQGQQFVINNLSAASFVGGSLSNCSMSKGTTGNSTTASTGSKSLSPSAALPSQQIDNSQSTHNQKSSPVCERNVVPSIVSS